MKKSVILLAGALIVLLSGCATQRPLWEADKIADSSSTLLNLTDQKGKVYATVKTNAVRVAIAVKNKVEETAGQVRAKLWIDAEERPNAYAWYNNGQPSITFNIGMLRILDGDEEAYAALYGHELAHLYLGHNAKAAQRNSARQAGSNALGYALGLAGIPGGGYIADIATTAIATVYSRDDEREADTQGMKYMLQAGYDPYGAVRLQERLANSSSGLSIPFLSSHPTGNERIKNMKKLAEIANASKTASSDTKTIDGESGNLSKSVTVQAEAAQAPASVPAMVRIPDKNYEIGKYEVTQAEWRAVMGNNPSSFKKCGDTCPVENVSWDDANEFIQKLNIMTGNQYRLPTAEEWEYACYGGIQTEYCGGNDANEVAWTSANTKAAGGNSAANIKSGGALVKLLADGSFGTPTLTNPAIDGTGLPKEKGGWGQTHPAGQKQANGYGLYDMSGNVSEWMSDCWEGHCSKHEIRGGSWYGRPVDARVLDRISSAAAYRSTSNGFRLARTLDAPSTEPVVATPPTAHVVATPSSNTLPSQSKSAANRLRELNTLYKDGVINQKDFETKKQEILESM